MKSIQWMASVRRRLAEHLSRGTTDHVIHTVHRLSTRETYLNPSRDKVAQHAPNLICPSFILRPGYAMSGTHPDGTPVLVYRDRRDSTVKAYVNRCRHRGSPLVRDSGASDTISLGRSSTLVCKYHAWTYDASTGALKGVPGEANGFPCLDKDDHALSPVECVEAAGGVWVGGEKLKATGFWSISEVTEELKPIFQLPIRSDNSTWGDNPLVAYREWRLNANWQLLVETFLESYHVKSLHRDTLNLVSHSNVMVTDTLDHCSFRMTVPLKNFTSFVSDATTGLAEDVDFFGQTTTTYFIFPNTAIAFFKRFVLFLSVEPQDNSLSFIKAWGVEHNLYEREEKNVIQRDFESVLAGVEEDWDCSVEIQRGLDAAQRNVSEGQQCPVFTYGRFEGCNVMFLEGVGQASHALTR